MLRWIRKRVAGRRRRHEHSEAWVTYTDPESHIYEEIPDLIPTESRGAGLRVREPQVDGVTETGAEMSRLHYYEDPGVTTPSSTIPQDYSESGGKGRQARPFSDVRDRIQNRYMARSKDVNLNDAGDMLTSEGYVDMNELSSQIPSDNKLQTLHHFRHTCRYLALGDKDRPTIDIPSSSPETKTTTSLRTKRCKMYYKLTIPSSDQISSKPEISVRGKAKYRPAISQHKTEIYRSKNKLLSDIIRQNNDRQMSAMF